MSNSLFEYRGVRDLVCAELITDTTELLSYGTPFSVAGLAELGRTTENSSEPHYYDNVPAVVVSSVGADTVTCTCSGIPLDVLAQITGQTYDTATGTFVEGQRETKYFALGYKTKKTNGNEVYVWRYKGQFSIPDSTHSTETDGTDANGQEVVFTGISTTHKFTKTGKGAKAINVDLEKNLCDVSTFFDTVTTIDDLVATAVATPTANPISGALISGDHVSLACTTANATIYYTDDGTTPTSASTEYSTPIEITTGKTIKAIAIKTGMTNSSVMSETYTISA